MEQFKRVLDRFMPQDTGSEEGDAAEAADREAAAGGGAGEAAAAGAASDADSDEEGETACLGGGGTGFDDALPDKRSCCMLTMHSGVQARWLHAVVARFMACNRA